MDLYFIFKLILLLFFIICISFFGLLNASHFIYVFISVELIFTSMVLTLLTVSKLFDELNGLILSLILLGLIAAETALGLVIMIKLQKTELLLY